MQLKNLFTILTFWVACILTITVIPYTAHTLYEYSKNQETLIENLTLQLAQEREEKAKLLTKANSFLSTLLEKPVNLQKLTKYSTQVTLTAYTARKEECNAEPWKTASGRLSRVGIIAISRDLETELGIKLHERVHLSGFGLVNIEDRMGQFKRKNTNNPVKITKSVDILFANLEAAKRFTPREVTLTWFD